MTLTHLEPATPVAAAPVVRLSDQQLRFFETFGYLRLPGLMTEVMPTLTMAFEHLWASRGGGHEGRPHDGKARSSIVPFIDQDATLSALLDDPRILGVASSLLGDDFTYLGSDGNYYVGDTAWHADGAHPIDRYLKIAFYLDPLDGSNGALRVIPGSHHLDSPFRRLLDQHRDPHTAFGLHGSEVPAQVLAVTPGDLVVFHHNTYHSSWNGGTRRRMFTMNLCQRIPPERIPELRDYIASHARFFLERHVGPEMLRTATPERLRHLEQVLANDDMLPELSRQRRAQGHALARD